MTSDPLQGRPALDSFDRPEAAEPRLLDTLFELPRVRVLLLVLAAVSLIVLADSTTQRNVSLGILYMIPIALGSLAFGRLEIIALALVCSVLREHLGPYSWEPHALTRLLSTFVTFGMVGLLLGEIARNRRMQLSYLRDIRVESLRRKAAEEQMRMVVESSPAAIVTADAEGLIELANRAAHSLLEVGPGGLLGRNIGEFLPAMGDLQDRRGTFEYRTTTTCRGKRAGGEQFLASVWFTSFATRDGRKLAAIFTDNSEDLRDQQESNLESLLRSTRVLVGSVSHEIRNVCAAIAVVHANLGRIPGVTENADYAALSTLAHGLSRLATVELQSANENDLATLKLGGLLEEFRIVLQPALSASEIELELRGVDDLPMVIGDHHSLLQVFLNLARNSLRAMENAPVRRITVEASVEKSHALVRFNDSGPGPAHPERMFRAFQEGADSVGLGLFVSRSLVRASGGELYHEPSPAGCTMCVRLRIAAGQDQTARLISPEIHA
ncbi:MAG: PAS domain-containing sensor histidine kinase [Bryobacteraceae bacterium]|nr:PAS domain-containing sensor histidine kinase [Bryobacteraceae bacterium]